MASRDGLPPERGGYAILIVDDQPEMRTYIRRCLRAFQGGGHRIAEAADGLEALEVLGRAAFDVVITDVVMPRMDGLTLCRRMNAAAPGIPVLLITGAAPDEARRQARHLAVAGMLCKPFNGRKLCRALDALLPPR